MFSEAILINAVIWSKSVFWYVTVRSNNNISRLKQAVLRLFAPNKLVDLSASQESTNVLAHLPLSKMTKDRHFSSLRVSTTTGACLSVSWRGSVTVTALSLFCGSLWTGTVRVPYVFQTSLIHLSLFSCFISKSPSEHICSLTLLVFTSFLWVQFDLYHLCFPSLVYLCPSSSCFGVGLWVKFCLLISLICSFINFLCFHLLSIVFMAVALNFSGDFYEPEWDSKTMKHWVEWIPHTLLI